MSISKTAQKEITEIISNQMERIITRVTFDSKKHQQERPFHAALVPIEIWKGAKFERSFVTSLGQTVFEKIAVVIAKDHYQEAIRNYRLEGEITQGELAYIEKLLRELEHRNQQPRTPDWEEELEELKKAIRGSKQKVTVIADLYVQTAEKELFFEIKSSKPNADQSKVSKEKLLKIQAIKKKEPVETFFALMDNPYGTKENYGWAHPKRYFDMNQSNCVLIGKEFWDYLGGNGTWEQLIELFEKVGKIYKKRINEEYL
jgi:hypothetical protein